MSDVSLQPDPATGKAALEAIRAELMAIALGDLRTPNTDPEAAALRALAVAKLLQSRPEVVARFRKLPADEFPLRSLDLLEPAAIAVLHTRAELASAIAAAGSTRVPIGLVADAADTKARMLRLLELYFAEELEAVARDLADIRRGSGHVDLAADLSRLATLYRAHASLLAGADARFYQASDADTAEALARQIQDHLAARQLLQGNPERELALRAWTLLRRVYEEIAAAGRWLLRHEDAGKLFPALIINGRRPKPAPQPAAEEGHV